MLWRVRLVALGVFAFGSFLAPIAHAQTAVTSPIRLTAGQNVTVHLNVFCLDYGKDFPFDQALAPGVLADAPVLNALSYAVRKGYDNSAPRQVQLALWHLRDNTYHTEAGESTATAQEILLNANDNAVAPASTTTLQDALTAKQVTLSVTGVKEITVGAYYGTASLTVTNVTNADVTLQIPAGTTFRAPAPRFQLMIGYVAQVQTSASPVGTPVTAAATAGNVPLQNTTAPIATVNVPLQNVTGATAAVNATTAPIVPGSSAPNSTAIAPTSTSAALAVPPVVLSNNTPALVPTLNAGGIVTNVAASTPAVSSTATPIAAAIVTTSAPAKDTGFPWPLLGIPVVAGLAAIPFLLRRGAARAIPTVVRPIAPPPASVPVTPAPVVAAPPVVTPPPPIAAVPRVVAGTPVGTPTIVATPPVAAAPTAVVNAAALSEPVGAAGPGTPVGSNSVVSAARGPMATSTTSVDAAALRAAPGAGTVEGTAIGGNTVVPAANGPVTTTTTTASADALRATDASGRAGTGTATGASKVVQSTLPTDTTVIDAQDLGTSDGVVGTGTPMAAPRTISANTQIDPTKRA